MKNRLLLSTLLTLLTLNANAMATELSIHIKPLYEEVETEYRITKNKSAILGEQGNLGIRKDLEAKIDEHAMGYTERTRQILVHTRAHDLFMMANTPEEAYNAYLLMMAAQKCLASQDGVGVSGAIDILLNIAQSQIDTEVRRLSVIRSEYMLKRGDFPAVDINIENEDFCQFTNQPIIVEKKAHETLG